MNIVKLMATITLSVVGIAATAGITARVIDEMLFTPVGELAFALIACVYFIGFGCVLLIGGDQ